MHFKNLLLSLSLLLTSLVPLYFIDNDEPKLLFLLISQIRYSHCKIIWSLSQISPFHIFFSNPSFSFLLVLKCLNAFKILIGKEIHVYEFRIDNGTRGEKVCVPYPLFLWWEQQGRGNGGGNLCFLSLGVPLALTRRTLALFWWFHHLRELFEISIGWSEREWKKKNFGLCGNWFGQEMSKIWQKYEMEMRVRERNEGLQISDFEIWIYRSRDAL